MEHAMSKPLQSLAAGMVYAPGEKPIFLPGDAIRILDRSPIGH